jgi:hypothetical protein
MGQTPGIITEILTNINYCELCDKPSDSENVCDVYTIDKFDASEQTSLSKNILVLCPTCKKYYDEGIISKKHLKACVMLREPGLDRWLSDLFDRYGIGPKQSTVNKGLMSRTHYRLVNDPNLLENVLLLSGIFIIFIGILLFSYGFNNINSYTTDAVATTAGDPGQYPPNDMFYLFLELAGVLCALLGLFFELSLVKGNGKINYH